MKACYLLSLFCLCNLTVLAQDAVKPDAESPALTLRVVTAPQPTTRCAQFRTPIVAPPADISFSMPVIPIEERRMARGIEIDPCADTNKLAATVPESPLKRRNPLPGLNPFRLTPTPTPPKPKSLGDILRERSAPPFVKPR